MKIGEEVLIHGYIDEIRKDIVIIRNEGGYFGTVKSEILNREQARWIPVSERLPEIHQDVLVSLTSLDVEVGFRAETEPYFYCKGDYIELQNVLAWMPLPEPYKVE